MNIGGYIRAYIRKRKQMKRFCSVWFLDEGVDIKTSLYYPDGTVVFKRHIHLSDVHELSFNTLKRVRLLLHTLHFPFRFECIFFLPFPYAQSRISALPFSPSKEDNQEELSSFISRHVWPCIEKQKKTFIDAKQCNELDALLVQSHVIGAKQGTENFPLTKETLATPTTLSFLHSFLFRPLFSKTHQVMPQKRAQIKGFVQQGLLSAQHISEDENNPFLYIRIGPRMTDVYQSDAEGIEYLDSIHSGYMNIYDVLHAHLDISIDTFHTILKRMGNKELSTKALRHIENVIKKEIEEFELGIKAFKKTQKIKKVYIDPGPLNTYLSSKRNFQKSLLSHHKFEDMEEDEHMREARVYQKLPLDNPISSLMLTFLRWLLPHSLKF